MTVHKLTPTRNPDSKLHPTISGPQAVYLKDIAATGLFGGTPTEVVRNFVAKGIRKAIADELIEVRDFAGKK